MTERDLMCVNVGMSAVLIIELAIFLWWLYL